MAEDITDLMGDAPARSAKAENLPQRRRREGFTPGGDRDMKLFVPEGAKDENYVYRWINDTTGGRISDKTVYDDWDVVTKAQLGQDGQNARNTGEGQQVRRNAGTSKSGEPLYAYLCRKPREYYEKDKEAEQKANDEVENTMRHGPTNDSAALEHSKAYLPMGQNRIG